MLELEFSDRESILKEKLALQCMFPFSRVERQIEEFPKSFCCSRIALSLIVKSGVESLLDSNCLVGFGL